MYVMAECNGVSREGDRKTQQCKLSFFGAFCFRQLMHSDMSIFECKILCIICSLQYMRMPPF